MKQKPDPNEFTDFGGPSAFEPTPLEQHLKEKNLSKLVGSAIFNLINKPPKIDRLPQNDSDFMPVIQNAGIEEKETHLQTDLTLTIPMNGNPLRELLEKTGLKDLEAILIRLADLAMEEGMEMIVAYDYGDCLEEAAEMAVDGTIAKRTGNVIVNLHRTVNLAHYPRMEETNEDFLNLFEWELF